MAKNREMFFKVYSNVYSHPIPPLFLALAKRLKRQKMIIYIQTWAIICRVPISVAIAFAIDIIKKKLWRTFISHPTGEPDNTSIGAP